MSQKFQYNEKRDKKNNEEVDNYNNLSKCEKELTSPFTKSKQPVSSKCDQSVINVSSDCDCNPQSSSSVQNPNKLDSEIVKYNDSNTEENNISNTANSMNVSAVASIASSSMHSNITSLSTDLSIVNSCRASIPSTSSSSVRKLSSQKSAEMHFYMDKLREMVPYAKNVPKMSKVQLIHCAIDYITDLQESLEARVKRKLNSQSNPLQNRAPLADVSTVQQNHSNISSEDNLENSPEAPSEALSITESHPSHIVPSQVVMNNASNPEESFQSIAIGKDLWSTEESLKLTKQSSPSSKVVPATTASTTTTTTTTTTTPSNSSSNKKFEHLAPKDNDPSLISSSMSSFSELKCKSVDDKLIKGKYNYQSDKIKKRKLEEIVADD